MLSSFAPRLIEMRGRIRDLEAVDLYATYTADTASASISQFKY